MLQKNNRVEKEQQHFTTIITCLDDEGCGVAVIDDKNIHIDGALPGEEVSFYHLRKRKGQSRGRLVEIISASPDRITPPCQHAATCGGCRLQHLGYGAQIAQKTRILNSRLGEYDNVEPQQWLPVLTGDPFGYRRRARLSVRYYTRDDEVRVGFRSRFGGYVLALEHCPVLEDRVAGLLPALRDLIHGLSCRDRVPQVEVSLGDHDLALVVRHLTPLSSDDQQLLCAFGRQHEVCIYVQSKGPDTCYCLYPDRHSSLDYHLPEYGLEVSFTPVDFIQVNTGVNRQMIRQALELLDPQPGEVILDLFCGLGNFSLPLASKATRVIGVDFCDALIQGARQNAEHNGINNAQFFQANLAEEAAGELWNTHRPDKVLLDPSRSGALQIIRQMPADGPRKIVYISCNPASLARDAACLINDKGFHLTHAGLIDMFPHTNHIESMLVFSKT